MVIWNWTYGKERKERNILFNDSFPTFMVIWNWTYGKERKERNVLFNDALSTFYLQYMVLDIW